MTGDYEFRPGYVIDLDHIRSVSWTTQVSRDDLTLESRSSLGAALTIFEPGETVLADLLRVRPLGGNTEISLPEPIELREEVEQIYADQLSRSHEFIKDRLNRLEPRDMELLAAALLRSLGFRTRVTPGGPDRGRDVVASMDGLGLQPPRVLCEVKHRKGQQMGSQDIRSFVAGLRSDDRGLYLSSGGFTREAKYEAERAAIPTTLLDLDELAKLVVEHYERFDTAGKALIPLERFYWPKP